MLNYLAHYKGKDTSTLSFQRGFINLVTKIMSYCKLFITIVVDLLGIIHNVTDSEARTNFSFQPRFLNILTG